MQLRIKVGGEAPQFDVHDINEDPVSLSDYDDGYVLIAFLRYAGCPWCNLAIHRLTMETPLLRDSQCSVVAFVQSSKQNIITNIYERHSKKPEFPIIADSHQSIYKAYSVRPSLTQSIKQVRYIPHWVHAVRHEGFSQANIDGNLFLAPAMFLVSARSKEILVADYDANLYEHDTFTGIYEAIVIDKRSANLA